MLRSLVLFVLLSLPLSAIPAWGEPTVTMKTSLGDIRIELDRERAPLSVENFLAYADAGFYDGTIFHRVIDGFMIQGGGFGRDLKRKATRPPIRNEAENGLKNRRGSIAMARTSAVDSATSQFFINLKDNDFLDHRGNDARGYGYAVFGRVVDGMEVVDHIAKVRTRQANALFQSLPTEPVVIEAVTRDRD